MGSCYWRLSIIMLTTKSIFMHILLISIWELLVLRLHWVVFTQLAVIRHREEHFLLNFCHKSTLYSNSCVCKSLPAGVGNLPIPDARLFLGEIAFHFLFSQLVPDSKFIKRKSFHTALLFILLRRMKEISTWVLRNSLITYTVWPLHLLLNHIVFSAFIKALLVIVISLFGFALILLVSKAELLEDELDFKGGSLFNECLTALSIILL
jgi:hypothetical protein